MFSFKLFFNELYYNAYDLDHRIEEDIIWLESVADISKVMDTHWEDQLPTKKEIESGKKSSPIHAIFRFNVIGDGCADDSNVDDPCNCETVNGISTCYKVAFTGRPEDGVTVSFARGDEIQDIRASYIENGKRTLVGANVFTGVKMALEQYMKALDPISVQWNISTAVDASRGAVRDKTYNTWFSKNLFPHKLIGIQGYWVKREVYDNEFVPNGFPKVPETVTYTITDKEGERITKTESLNEDSSAALKIAAMKQMNEKIKLISGWNNKLEKFKKKILSKNKQARDENRDEKFKDEKRRIGFERSKDARLNPDHFNIDDYVKLKKSNDVEFFFHGIIKSFHGTRGDNKLYAEVQFQSEPRKSNFDGKIEIVDVKDLKSSKNHGNEIKDYIRIISEKSKEYNLRVGDKIIFNDKSFDISQKLLGSIQKLLLSRNLDGSIGMKANILWDDHAKSILKNKQKNLVNASFLRKTDPQEELEIKTSQRDLGIQKRIQKNTNRTSANKIQNDMEASNFGLNIGDEVEVTSGMHKGKTGKILLFLKSQSGLIAQVASINMPNFKIKVEYLKKKSEDISMAGTSIATSNECTFIGWLTKKLYKQ